MPPKKRKVEATSESPADDVQPVSAPLDVPEKPPLMQEGLTKSAAKALFRDLQCIWGDFIEHGQISRVRRLLKTDIQNALTKAEKERFIAQVKAQDEDPSLMCEKMDMASLFPEVQAVIDYKSPVAASSTPKVSKKRKKRRKY